MSNLATKLEETIKDSYKKIQEEENQKMFQFEKNKLYAYLEDLKDSLVKHRAFIAGGTITSLFTGSEINDIDIYFRSEKSLIAFLEDHWMDGESFVTCLTKKSVLMINGTSPDYKNLQMIHFKYFENAQEIFDTFDFTVCMGAFDFATEQFILHPEFMKHNSQRILKFNKTTAFPIVSLLRVQKYNRKHYTISKPEFIRIALKCMDLDIKTIEELKEHMGGMYGINYDKIMNLDEGEEFSLDLIIDKIANIALDEDYFKKPVEIKFNDIDDIIDTVKKKPIHTLTINNKMYRVKHNRSLKQIEAKAPFFVDIDPNKYFEETKFYKWVMKQSNGEYRSHYDGTFIYEDGKESTAKGEKLWLLNKNNIDSGTYRNSGVVIEVSIKPEDFIGINGNDVYAKACTTIREVPKNEYEGWFNDEDEEEVDEYPF